MATTQGGRRTRRAWAAEDEAAPAFGIVIWPGAGRAAEAPPVRAPRVRLREVFAPAAAGR